MLVISKPAAMAFSPLPLARTRKWPSREVVRSSAGWAPYTPPFWGVICAAYNIGSLPSSFCHIVTSSFWGTYLSPNEFFDFDPLQPRVPLFLRGGGIKLARPIATGALVWT